MNSKEQVQKTPDLYKNEALKKLTWHLDREVWANVEKGESTTSWGRRQSMIEINKYTTSEVNRVMGELVGIMTKYRDELWAETGAGFTMAGNAVNHCIQKAQSLISGDTAGEKTPCDNYVSSTGTCNNCGAKVEEHIQEWAGEKEPEPGSEQTKEICRCPLFLEVNNGKCSICGLDIV